LLDIDQVPQDLQRIRLRELLEDEGSLLLVLTQHLGHESAAKDADEGLTPAVLLEQKVYLLNIKNQDRLIEALVLQDLAQHQGEDLDGE
jgi:hypothetical protein